MESLGACKFCGQAQAVTVPDEFEGDLAEFVTLYCDCPEAERYQYRAKELDKATAKLVDLFGSLCTQHGIDPVTEKQFEMMEFLLRLKVNMVFTTITIDLGSGIKAKINRNSNGDIEITRTDTQKRKR